MIAVGWISKAWGEFAGPEDNSAADKVTAAATAAESLMSVASSTTLDEAINLSVTSIQLNDPSLDQSGAEVVVECQALSGDLLAYTYAC